MSRSSATGGCARLRQGQTTPFLDLWITPYDEIDRRDLVDSCWDVLSPAERSIAARMKAPDAFVQYLTARALVRMALSRYAPVAPQEWQFEIGEHGKPRIAGNPSKLEGLDFNLSHTRGLVIVGVTKGRAIGVDVENHQARGISMDIAQRHYGPAEFEALKALPAGDQNYRCFEHWTFKESYIKARGQGLSIPLDKFEFRLDRPGVVDVVIDPELDDARERWCFLQLFARPQHMIAICIERGDATELQLSAREVFPLSSEQSIPVQLSRVGAGRILLTES